MFRSIELYFEVFGQSGWLWWSGRNTDQIIYEAMDLKQANKKQDRVIQGIKYFISQTKFTSGHNGETENCRGASSVVRFPELCFYSKCR